MNNLGAIHTIAGTDKVMAQAIETATTAINDAGGQTARLRDLEQVAAVTTSFGATASHLASTAEEQAVAGELAPAIDSAWRSLKASGQAQLAARGYAVSVDEPPAALAGAGAAGLTAATPPMLSERMADHGRLVAALDEPDTVSASEGLRSLLSDAREAADAASEVSGRVSDAHRVAQSSPRDVAELVLTGKAEVRRGLDGNKPAADDARDALIRADDSFRRGQSGSGVSDLGYAAQRAGAAMLARHGVVSHSPAVNAEFALHRTWQGRVPCDQIDQVSSSILSGRDIPDTAIGPVTAMVQRAVHASRTASTSPTGQGGIREQSESHMIG